MFTDGEIDKVMTKGGYNEDSVITTDDVLKIVEAAHDCGLLDNSITVWQVTNLNVNGFLVTFDVGTKLRLASMWMSSQAVIGKDSRLDTARDVVTKILAFVWDEATELKRVHVDLHEN